MGKVIADMSMSLDGFVAGPDDQPGPVFGWYEKEQPAWPGGAPEGTGVGVIVYGRRTFEVANGWGGNHPIGVPVIVVTHELPGGWPREGSTIEFESGGVEPAIARAQEIAGEKIVAVGSPTITQQCLDLGLLDSIQVKLVPVLLGEGIRFFENLKTAPIELSDPRVTEGNGVTHLHYDVR